MELERIFKLIDAGFTKDEILKLTEEPAAEEPKDEPAAQPEEKPEPKSEEPKAEGPDMSALLNEIKGMRDDLRKHALMSDSFTPEDSRQEAEKILASVINPPLPDTKKGKK